MIPDRIFLSGFLSYREPQEVRFEGRTLWMLTGPNGSGKSALFDALTYVLFGQHRGGKQNARGLIHHARDDFLLEFDFTLDDKQYRARRTLTRQGRCTRQIDQWRVSSEHPAGTWHAIPETQTEKGFAQWIDMHVALTYDTFTTSVLLLQGRAENLLMAAPADRHRLLCQIVGLDRIEQLHQLARQRLARTEGAVTALRQQAKRLPSVTASQLQQLQDGVQAAEAEHGSQTDRLNQLARTLEQARRWEELTGLSERLQIELQQLDELSQALQCSQQQYARWTELGEHLAALKELAHTAQQISRCRPQLAAAQAAREDLQTKSQLVLSDLRQCQQSLDATRRQAASTVDSEKSLTLEHTELERLHCAASRFDQVRTKLQQTHDSLKEIERQVTETHKRRADGDGDLPSEESVQLAQDAVRAAAEQLARRKAFTDRTRQQMERLHGVASEQVCAYCLQPLTPQHVRQEESRLTEELRESERQLDRAQCELSRAEERHRYLRLQRNAKLSDRDEIDQHLNQLTIHLHARTLARQDLDDQCRQAYQELPAAFQRAVSEHESPDWNTTRFPTGTDLLQLARSLEEVRQKREASALSLRTHQQTIERLDRQLRHNNNALQTLQQQLQESSDQVTIATGRLAGLTEVHLAARQAVPERWRDLAAEELNVLADQIEDERRQLHGAGEKAERHDLDRVLARHLECRSQRTLVVQQLAGVPAQARRSGHEIEPLIQEANRVLKRRELELQGARELASRAVADRDHRAVLLQKLRDAQQQQCLARRLVELLGREGLQRDLLRGAEKAIVEYANAILDRLAGGQLYVELAQPAAGRSGTPKVLDLLARTTSNRAVQDVAFLSGSQKFRVSVALSLAIGQFASNARRPVQAVIIDEGFGCLDTVNRQVMIQELQNLRGQLKRILLVSHEDEFASAFPDGYYCELVDGTTRLTPFHP